MANLPGLQERTEGDPVQKTRMAQHDNDVLVSSLSLAVEHRDNLLWLTSRLPGETAIWLRSLSDHEYWAGMSPLIPRFSDLSKVRVTCEECEPYEGYIVGSQLRDGRWIYKISVPDDLRGTETYDNWVPEEWLELVK
jgi:hypothetical protein